MPAHHLVILSARGPCRQVFVSGVWKPGAPHLAFEMWDQIRAQHEPAPKTHIIPAQGIALGLVQERSKG
jgi:hypothetical protein